MIVSKDFLGKLRLYFGLNLYEARIWTALLSRGVSSAGELSDIANVPRSRSYDILESLERKGFIVQKPGKPLKYSALPPAEVVERVRKNLKVDADKSSQGLDSLREGELFKGLRELFGQGAELVDPHEYHGAMRGHSNIYDHLDHTLRKAKESVTIVTTESGLNLKGRKLKSTFEELKRKGVKIRIAAPLTKNTAEVVKELSSLAEIRHTNTSARFCLVDGKDVTFMVKHDAEVHPEFDIGVWAQSPFFAETLGRLFDLAWDEMKGKKR